MPAKPNAAESVAARTHDIARTFDVPARLLFDAYSKPEHLMKWFGPKGYPLTMCNVDFRVGGRFRFAMTGPDGKENQPFGGTYLEIVPNKKIVYDNKFETPGSPMMVHTVTFEEKGGKTLMTISTLFESLAMKDEYLGLGFDGGVNSGFDQLGDVVADMARREKA